MQVDQIGEAAAVAMRFGGKYKVDARKDLTVSAIVMRLLLGLPVRHGRTCATLAGRGKCGCRIEHARREAAEMRDRLGAVEGVGGASN